MTTKRKTLETDWTKRETDRAIALWQSGMPATDIAKKIKTKSRQGVLGKIYRLRKDGHDLRSKTVIPAKPKQAEAETKEPKAPRVAGGRHFTDAQIEFIKSTFVGRLRIREVYVLFVKEFDWKLSFSYWQTLRNHAIAEGKLSSKYVKRYERGPNSSDRNVESQALQIEARKKGLCEAMITEDRVCGQPATGRYCVAHVSYHRKIDKADQQPARAPSRF